MALDKKQGLIRLLQFLSWKVVPLSGGVVAAIVIPLLQGVEFYGKFQSTLGTVIGVGVLLRFGTETFVQEHAFNSRNKDIISSIKIRQLKLGLGIVSIAWMVFFALDILEFAQVCMVSSLIPLNITSLEQADLRSKGYGQLAPIFEYGSTLLIAVMLFWVSFPFGRLGIQAWDSVAICYLLSSILVSALCVAVSRRTLAVTSSSDSVSSTHIASYKAFLSNFLINISQYLMQWSPLIGLGFAGENRLAGIFALGQRAVLVFHVFIQAMHSIHSHKLAALLKSRSEVMIQALLLLRTVRSQLLIIFVLTSSISACLLALASYGGLIDMKDWDYSILISVYIAELFLFLSGLSPVLLLFSNYKVWLAIYGTAVNVMGFVMIFGLVRVEGLVEYVGVLYVMIVGSYCLIVRFLLSKWERTCKAQAAII